MYKQLRGQLGESARAHWDAHPHHVANGIVHGRFERYFEIFRTRMLPLVHRRKTVEELLQPKGHAARIHFYEATWDTWRWRALFRAFFSRFAMGRLGRHPSLFQHVEGRVADRILARTRHALTELEPAENPYVQWILTGSYRTALPLAFRRASFEPIRASLDRLEWRLGTLDEAAARMAGGSLDGANLSDIYEYLPEDAYHRSLGELARALRGGGRLAYWNLLVPRSRPPAMADRLVPQEAEAHRLHHLDKAFFYSAFILEEAP